VGSISSTQPNPPQSENFEPTNQPNPLPNWTPYNQQQTFGYKEDNLGTLFHRNIMTVSKTQEYITGLEMHQTANSQNVQFDTNCKH